jgi:hypothetical protein
MLNYRDFDPLVLPNKFELIVRQRTPPKWHNLKVPDIVFFFTDYQR